MSLPNEKPHHSPIDRQISWLEKKYASTLSWFLSHPKIKVPVYASAILVVVLLTTLVLPKLPREVVAKPDTDWVYVGLDTQGNTLMRQMETQAEELERAFLKEIGDKVAYTFSQVYSVNGAFVMARLKNKKDMPKIIEALEKKYINSPENRYDVGSWNPSELPLPSTSNLKLSFRGGTSEEREEVVKEISELLQEKKLYPRVSTTPTMNSHQGALSLQPLTDLWSANSNVKIPIKRNDLIDLVRISTEGKRIGYFPSKNQRTPVLLAFPPASIGTIEEIASLPLGISGKILPLKALVEIKNEKPKAVIYREEGKEIAYLEADLNKSDIALKDARKKQTESAIADWQKKNTNKKVNIFFEEPDQEFQDAIKQLTFAVGLSIGLIFLTMVFQFGTLIEPLLVLVSVPLGFIGVVISLFVFKSTLSLNSALGIILLNGIAVANSILLVDFIKHRFHDGSSPKEAALEAGKARLRPILITSLTTILGMAPIAVGAGDGGKILQPLGIAVCGGMWVSTLLTLYLVPALHVAYLESRVGRKQKAKVPFYSHLTEEEA
jgi:multidrug efflux pump subunit AcrB